MSQTILIVEDEEKIADILKDYLKSAGYHVEWTNNGSLAVGKFKKTNPALVLLDVMLPGLDGMEICREIRKISSIPIIMITAKVEEIDRLIGLELGADDYICKPFSPREVVARVKAVLRRAGSGAITEKISEGEITLDLSTKLVKINNQNISLTRSEFSLLKTLMSQPNRVFSRNELLNQVQGYDFEGYDRTIDTHIKNLRKKIKKCLPDRDIIKAVYGTGYKFCETENP